MSTVVPELDTSWMDRLAGAVGRLVGTRGAVFCFHGIDADATPSRSSMHVPLGLLEAIVDSIRSLGTIVPLRDLVSRHIAGRSTRGMLAVTADDGYASWLAAEPFLERHGMPVTIFAVSGALDTGRRFWWDRLEDSVSRAHPERWRQFEDECDLPAAYRQGQPAAEGPVRPLRQWVLAQHAGRWPEALEEPLTQLENELGPRTHQRAMTEMELAGFLARTGADVGVHTVSHAALPYLPDQELVTEIRQGYEALRERFPDTLPYLALPFGLFDARTLRLAADAGMTVSLTLPGCPLDRPFSAEVGMPRLCVVRQHTPGKLTLKASGVAWLLDRMRGEAVTSYPVLPSPTT
jgi:peptidoglycan/xylan/chitin deacetylase (PgdA/CDA1 family)